MANDNQKQPATKDDQSATYRVTNVLSRTQANAYAGDPGAIQANAFEPEDEYRAFYVGGDRDNGVLQPPYNLRTLDRLSQENNALGPCIEAMVTNIDGTGFDFDNGEEESEDDEDDTLIEELRELFAEPWPGISFLRQRRMLRRDLERTGNAFLEVLRNPNGEIVFWRHVDAKMMRLVKLDRAVPVDKKVKRKGVEVAIKVNVRERRYVQLVNGVSLVFFKEFGASRDLNKSTGNWAQKGNKLPAQNRATEIIHFTTLPDAHTPYGIPRWIAQIPSVLGSRKAEEFNLQFFDNGGVPPVMIILQGGMLQSETRKRIEHSNMGLAKDNNRMQIIEVEPSSGTLDATAASKIVVERFGSERQADSMFENYDEKCEKRVRRAFRLSPIFVGAADDFSFATAFASYTVAEAQVFKPERDDFDEIINMTLIKELGYEGYKLISKPLVIEDATLKLQGIETGIQTGEVSMAGVIDEINEATGTKLKIMTPEEKAQKQRDAQAMGGGQMTVDPATGKLVSAGPPGAGPTPPGSPTGPNQQGGAPPAARQPQQGGPAGGPPRQTPARGPSAAVAKKDKAKKHDGTLMQGAGMLVRDLAHDALKALRKKDLPALGEAMAIFAKLDDYGKGEFRRAASDLYFIDTTLDPSGLGELAGCTLAVIAAQQLAKEDEPEHREAAE